jgi:hypothetical protein
METEQAAGCGERNLGWTILTLFGNDPDRCGGLTLQEAREGENVGICLFDATFVRIQDVAGNPEHHGQVVE